MSKEDSEYVLERIESVQRLLENRGDSESVQAMVDLALFRSRVESALSDESTPPDDIETAFYELLGNQRTLGLAFLDAMETDVNNLACDGPSKGSRGGPRSVAGPG